MFYSPQVGNSDEESNSINNEISNRFEDINVPNFNLDDNVLEYCNDAHNNHFQTEVYVYFDNKYEKASVYYSGLNYETGYFSLFSTNNLNLTNDSNLHF